MKIALAGTNTLFLLDILEECFSHENVGTSQSTVSTEKAEMETTIEEATSKLPEKTPATLPEWWSSYSRASLPLKINPHSTAGLPEPFFPVHGPETLSHYHCQFPSCTLESSQKAAACNHI